MRKSQNRKNYKKRINKILICVLVLMAIYIIISLLDSKYIEYLYKIKDIFLGISTGLFTGYILFDISNYRDIEIRKNKGKVEFLKELISIYNLFYECTAKCNGSITKKELKSYLENLNEIKRKYKKIRGDKTFMHIDKRMHDYAVENIGKGVFKKAKSFKTVKELRKYIDDNIYDITEINRYLNEMMDEYYNKYIDSAYK